MMFDRYIDLLRRRSYKTMIDHTDADHLIWMCETARTNLGSWPIDKVSRWLGYVQGCLTFVRLIDVGEERDFSRPLFHAAYDNPPETVERK